MAYNNPQLLKILAVIAKKPGNTVCADCNMPNPTWASFNLGVFICMNCSGVHRMLGTHITRVRSITLDHWDDTGVQTMAQTGNRVANLYWEAKLPPGQKITANSDENTRTRFIRAKYEQRLWYGQPSAEAIEASNTQTTTQSSHHPDEAGMTREQKIAYRQQRMNGVTSPSSTNSNSSTTQPTRPPQSSYTPQPVHQTPASYAQANTQSHNQPQLRHATSLPQISQHAQPQRSFNQQSNPDDLFAGLTPKVSVQSPPPSSSQSSPSPPPAAEPPRPKRVTGASPWVQRAPGSEPNYAPVTPVQTQSNASASNYYASVASTPYDNSIVAPVPVAAAPIDLMNFADPSPAAAPSGGFDFLGGSDSNQTNNQSYGGFDQAQSSPSDSGVNHVEQSMSAFSFFDANQPQQQSSDPSQYQSPPPAQTQPQQQQYAPQQSPQYAEQSQQQYAQQPQQYAQQSHYEQPQSSPAQSEPSGFDFVNDSGSNQASSQSNESTGYGFDFVNDSAPAAAPAASKPHKSRVTTDVFSDLVPESDAAPPELVPLADIQRKSSGDGLLAALSAPTHNMPSLGAPAYPPQHGYPQHPPAGYPVHPTGYPHQSPAGYPGYPSGYGQPHYPAQAGAPGYAYPPYAASSATH